MNEQLSTVLDLALASLESGEPVEAILDDHPAQSDELAPLLWAAQQLMLLKTTPPPTGSEAGLAAFLAEARAMRPEPISKNGRRRWLSGWRALSRRLWWSPRARLIAGSVVALIVPFALMGILIGLASDSLPGDWLYSVKLVGEEIRLAFTVDPTARAEYHLTRAEARTAEIRSQVEADRPISEATVTRLIQSLEASLIAAASANLPQIPRVLTTITETIDEQDRLLSMLEVEAGSTSQGQIVDHVRRGLTDALYVAQTGRSDVYTFRLNAKFGAVQLGRPLKSSQ